MLRSLDAPGQLQRSFPQSSQLGVPPTDRARPQVPAQPTTHFRGPPDSEPLLEPLIVIPTRSAQQSPKPEPHVIQRALEVLQAFDGCGPPSQAHLDRLQRRVESGDLIRKARLRHCSSPARGSRIESAVSARSRETTAVLQNGEKNPCGSARGKGRRGAGINDPLA